MLPVQPAVAYRLLLESDPMIDDDQISKSDSNDIVLFGGARSIAFQR